MKMGYNLNLVQTQKLIMTPELKQSIEILQYNALELNEFINEELMTNPILDRNETLSNLEYKEKEKEKVKSEIDEKIDKIDWKQVSDDIRIRSTTRKYKESGEHLNYDNFVASEITLHEHLISQLQYTLIEDKWMLVATYVIQCVNSSGYLVMDPNIVIEKFNVDEDTLEDIILTIQTFDPIGVCARDISECLLIQVVNKEIENKNVYNIINNYLEDVGANRLNKIAKDLAISIDDVKEAVSIIKNLEPKPGREYSSLKDITYIKPDVNLKKIDGEYVILVNESTAPKLHINSFYRKMLSEGEINEGATDYISKKLNSALRLIKNIEQRRNTIYKVVDSILEYQMDFFEKGPIHLRTLTLKDIADKIGVHESTVSRSTSGKYIQCPNGMFELKYFFQSGVATNRGEGVSSESIKIVIREMIEKESKDKPISDQNIALEFDKIGVKISRRTVAKYRGELGINSTSKRKKY